MEQAPGRIIINKSTKEIGSVEKKGDLVPGKLSCRGECKQA